MIELNNWPSKYCLTSSGRGAGQSRLSSTAGQQEGRPMVQIIRWSIDSQCKFLNETTRSLGSAISRRIINQKFLSGDFGTTEPTFYFSPGCLYSKIYPLGLPTRLSVFSFPPSVDGRINSILLTRTRVAANERAETPRSIGVTDYA